MGLAAQRTRHLLTTATEVFTVRPYTPHCQVIHHEGDHAVIGISPGNSYFSAQRVLDLAQWGMRNFQQVDIIYTDLHVADMYEALGYDPDEARRKAVKNLRGVRAKVNNAAAETDPTGVRLRARPMSALTDIPAYRALHSHLTNLLDNDPEFRTTCDSLVDSFLSSKVLDGKAATTRQREVCLKYVCAEAPLFLDTPAILGVPSSLNCYHQLLPMAELLYSRGYGLRASRNQGHAVITPAEGDPDAR
ncbi:MULTISPECIES: tRNA-dependent cyclodipeptide synthase [unclassified Streptomyces]|uniref:tRNA-dependent cyclodipeptide synthase n=1 Tax=unclassified Streptomyces TaxID=2593676 RepID=UPI000DC7C840|nr:MULTISPECIES: tRNA-dependent cyclodipeptide synthase [unclassified Streptomyces]AWZ08165.1 tRNA-dependent cyclodipeptide synthase [Streptomyces sp. ICC4]AWZ15961.1 tRNA-dependent cyclodipeptide synthase [Streptomyces sp. ICC1]